MADLSTIVEYALRVFFKVVAVYTEDVPRLQGRIKEKMSSLSGEELVIFNQKLKQANDELGKAISRGDADAGEKYEAAIFELCK